MALNPVPRLLLLSLLALSAVATGATETRREGTIQSFECGDNCYLTLRTRAGEELTGLCNAADPCNGWFEMQAMPDAYRGEPVQVTVGIGVQRDAEGTVMGEMTAFDSISFTRPDFTPPPPAEAMNAGEPAAAPPPEIVPFLSAGWSMLALESADLNGDGSEDRLLVIEESATDADPTAEGARALLVLIGDGKGAFKEAARNAEVVYCRTCGGVLGDPFAGIEATRKGFTVHNYGGSRERWGYDYRFGYSRRDNAWQLVGVTETLLDTFQPDTATTRNYAPPKDFGKIDLRDFKADEWLGEGPR